MILNSQLSVLEKRLLSAIDLKELPGPRSVSFWQHGLRDGGVGVERATGCIVNAVEHALKIERRLRFSRAQRNQDDWERLSERDGPLVAWIRMVMSREGRLSKGDA